MTINEILLALAPLLIIQFFLIIVALTDIIKRPTTFGPKWMWVLIILFVNIVGPILYFIIGRRSS